MKVLFYFDKFKKRKKRLIIRFSYICNNQRLKQQKTIINMIIKGIGLICVCFETSLSRSSWTLFSGSPVFASCEESVPTFTLLSVELLTILFSLETILLTSLLMAETILLIMLSVWLLLLFVTGFVVLVSGFAGVFGVTGLVGFGLGVIGFILI